MKKQALWLVWLAISSCLVTRPAAAQEADSQAPSTDSQPPSTDSQPPSTDSQAPSTDEPPPPTAPEPVPGPKPAAAAPLPIARGAPAPRPVTRRRLKPLVVTTGVPPTAQDVGSEADLLAAGTSDESYAVTLNKWTLKMKGYLRAPLRVGLGPRQDEAPGSQLHVPPRIVGLSSGTWEYIAIAPNPSFSMYFTYGNPLVSANVIFNTNTMIDAGYHNLDQIGGISQAYLSLKFPNAFGSSGGLSWTVGAFGNRYGLAGPRGTSSGYYGTYLFGRTHQTGEVLTANVDLSDRLQLVLEHGLGAKLEVIPFITTKERAAGGPEADYLQGQGKGPQGSTFLHHAHAGLYVDEWLKVAYHYMTSWTPDDNNRVNESLCMAPVGPNPPECVPRTRVKEARMTVFGGELHLDSDRVGNGYIGYSHARGENLYPLGDALQVIHSSTGRSFKENYFGRKDRDTGLTPTNSSGTVDTLLSQYILRLSSIMDRPLGARDVIVAVYGMYNHVKGPLEDPQDTDVDMDKLKFGAEVQFELFKFMTAGLRVDRVLPNLDDTSDAYDAVSPRVLLYAVKKSKQYIMLNYTHYFLGPRAYPGSPYSELLEADPDMFMIAAIMSFGP